MKTPSLIHWLCLASATLALPSIGSAQTYPAFNPIVTTTIDADHADRTTDGIADGVIRYSSYTVRPGRTVRYSNTVNPQRAVVIEVVGGNVSIQGIVDVSGNSTLQTRNAGPGGYPGGAAGIGYAAGMDGSGLGAGGAGLLPMDRNAQGTAGGGAGHATEGLHATARSGFGAGPGGNAVALGAFVPPYDSLGGAGGGSGQPYNGGRQPNYDGLGGSGGGGGSGRIVSGGVNVRGGVGGGGGGAILFFCPHGRIQIGDPVWSATVNVIIPPPPCGIYANGANGGYAYGSGLSQHAGPGGGGAGGVIVLSSPRVEILGNALLSVRGGYGGGISSEPYDRNPDLYSTEADGGQGYIVYESESVLIHHAAQRLAVEDWPSSPFCLTQVMAGRHSQIVTFRGSLERSTYPASPSGWMPLPFARSPHNAGVIYGTSPEVWFRAR